MESRKPKKKENETNHKGCREKVMTAFTHSRLRRKISSLKANEDSIVHKIKTEPSIPSLAQWKKDTYLWQRVDFTPRCIQIELNLGQCLRVSILVHRLTICRALLHVRTVFNPRQWLFWWYQWHQMRTEMSRILTALEITTFGNDSIRICGDSFRLMPKASEEKKRLKAKAGVFLFTHESAPCCRLAVLVRLCNVVTNKSYIPRFVPLIWL